MRVSAGLGKGNTGGNHQDICQKSIPFDVRCDISHRVLSKSTIARCLLSCYSESGMAIGYRD